MAGEWVHELIRREIEGVAALRASAHVDFPNHVHLETLAVCNAACGFCPYPTLDRIGTRMPDDLIEKIIDDLSDIPASLPFHLAPYKVNEPFLDKRLPDILETINQRLPHAKICLFSNGTVFTDKLLARLATIENVAYLNLSVNECNPVAYEALMRMPFARTVDRLRRLHDWAARGAFAFPITINRVMDGTDQDNAFLRWGTTEFPAFRTTVSIRKDWNQQVDERTTLPTAPNLPCKRWFDLSIMADGKVTMCCMDGKGEWPIGDARASHLLDIYNADSQRAIRTDAVSRLELDTCRNCTHL